MISQRVAGKLLFGVLFMALLTGCEMPPHSTDRTPSVIPSTTTSFLSEAVPTHQPGMASFVGILYSYTVDLVLQETLFYLTPALGGNNNIVPPVLVGPLVENRDARGFTNAAGQIEVLNIPPGKYYIIVWAPPYNWEPVVVSPEDPTPLLVELGADDHLTFDTLYVSWP